MERTLIMTMSAEITDARAEVARARTQIAETVAELETRIAEPLAATRAKLDVPQLVKTHPWASLAAAAGIGALIAGTRADVKAAQIAKDTALDAARATADTARELPGKARNSAQSARRATGTHVDTFAASLLIRFIDRLREAESSSVRA